MRKGKIGVLALMLGLTCASTDAVCQPQYVAGGARAASQHEQSANACYGFASCLWRWIGDNHDAIIAISTFGLLIVTTALAIYTARLWRETKNLAKDAKTASTAQREDFGKSIKIARRANRLSRFALVAANRPWVGIDNWIIKWDEHGVPTQIIGDMRNVGKSPAIHLSVHFQGHIRPSGFVPDIPSIEDDSVADMILPGCLKQLHVFNSDMGLPDKETWKEIENGKWNMWVVARIVYDFPGNVGDKPSTIIVAKYKPSVKGFGVHGDRNTAS